MVKSPSAIEGGGGSVSSLGLFGAETDELCSLSMFNPQFFSGDFYQKGK